MMNSTQRFAAIGLAAALLLSGFVFGRITDGSNATAETSKAAVTQPNQLTQTSAQPAGPAVNAEDQAFYLKDFKTGYDDGYHAGATGQMSNVPSTDRAGYNEGFKDGYADAVQGRTERPARPVQPAQVATSTRPVPVVYRGGQQTYYRPAYSAPVRRRSSKLKTALTIAAPAAIGAGIGAAAGGGKGAAVGALIGGGGGALYHLIKNRHRD